MRTTDATKASSTYRKYRKALSMANGIERRLSFYLRKMPDRLNPESRDAANATIADLRAYAADLLEHGREINSSLSSREIIKHPVQHTLNTLFPGLPPPNTASLTDLEHSVLTYMTELGRDIRATAYKTACTYEIAYRTTLGWHLLFDTLTVTDDQLAHVFNPHATAFKNYIRRVKRSVQLNEQDNCHSYFACVEQGGTTGRLHIHVLHFLARIAREARDPNLGLHIAYKRELECYKGIWPHGYNSPVIVRYHPLDAWGKLGYRWPYDRQRGDDLQVKSAMAIAGYMSKYIVKSASTEKETYQWRIRKSHNLGLPIIWEIVNQLPLEHLEPLACLQSFPIRLNQRSVPAHLLRFTMMRRLSMTKSQAEYCQMANGYMPRLSPLHYLRVSTKTGTTYNRPNSTPIDIQGINKEGLSKALQSLIAATAHVDAKFFPRSDVTGKAFSNDYAISTGSSAK